MSTCWWGPTPSYRIWTISTWVNSFRMWWVNRGPSLGKHRLTRRQTQRPSTRQLKLQVCIHQPEEGGEMRYNKLVRVALTAAIIAALPIVVHAEGASSAADAAAD